MKTRVFCKLFIESEMKMKKRQDVWSPAFDEGPPYSREGLKLQRI